MAAWGGAPIWSTFSTWSGDEGSATITRYFLTSPIREVGPVSRDRYAEFQRVRRGDTVVKRGGVWQTVRNRRQDWLDDCDVVLRGGYENEVTSTQRAELVAAGYTVESRSVEAQGPSSGYAWGDTAFWSGRVGW